MIRSFIAQQGQTLYDLCIKAYGDMRGLPYLLRDNPNLYNNESEGGGYAIKCLAANNEYMSSPTGDYFGSTVNDLDIEYIYSEFDNSYPASYILCQGVITSDAYLRVTFLGLSNIIQIVIKDDDGNTVSINNTVTVPVSGKINIKGISNNIEFYLDDVLITTTDASSLTTLNNISNTELYLGGAYMSSGGLVTTRIPTSIIHNSLRIGDNIWTFPEGSGSITTNSQGVVTTLFSDVSTNTMWIGSGGGGSVIDFQGEEIFYDDSITFKTVFNEVFIPQRNALDDYLVYEGQTVYDLAVQLYGDIEEGLIKVVPVLNDIDNGIITQGSLIKREVPISNIGKQFNNNNILIATNPVITTEPTGEGFDYVFDFVWGVSDAPQEGILESGLEAGLIG